MKELFTFLLLCHVVISCYVNVYINLTYDQMFKRNTVTREDVSIKNSFASLTPVSSKVIYKIVGIKTVKTSGEDFLQHKPLSYGRVVSVFGKRGTRLHTGIDLAAPAGAPIYAVAPGVITLCGWHYGYGKFIAVTHAGGMVSRYAHCSTILVKHGQRVSTGHCIGKVGSTGRARGSHLHFEIMRNNVFVNPANLLGNYFKR